MEFAPQHFQQSAGITCYYNTKNWSYCFVDYEEGLGRTLKVIQLDHNVPSWPLHEQPILVPENAQSVWLRVDVDRLVYRYSYSFDGEAWQSVPIAYEAWKLSDDYIGGRGFFTGAFVGLALRGYQRRWLLRRFRLLQLRAGSGVVIPQAG